MNNASSTAMPYIEQFDGADPSLDDDLLHAAEAGLNLLLDVRRSIDLGPNSRDRRLAQMCQAFFIGKIHRVTRAMVMLVRHGQGQEATGLLREQNEFTIKLLFFQKHPDKATLFTVSSDIERLRMAERNLKTAASADEKAERQALVASNQVVADQTRKEFPALVVPCTPSACKKVGTPHEHDLTFPNPRDMLSDLLRGWLKAAYDKEGRSVTQKFLNEQTQLLSNRIYLVRANFISQEKHGLQFALFNNLVLESDLQIQEPLEQVDNPNELLHWIIASIEPALTDTVAVNSIDGLHDRINGFLNSVAECKARLQIPGPNPAITAFRVA